MSPTPRRGPPGGSCGKGQLEEGDNAEEHDSDEAGDPARVHHGTVARGSARP